ncbi:hypothetical protein DL96DRAFT_1679564 [Flagelloscypha sp. PMI_526]|nr:hypothetical protein DL96DRAFT_1679564 [Flagelloscypha sp. PMI_526]
MDAKSDERVDQDEIDLQLAKLRAEIHALSLKRNSVSPGIRVPSELLQQIFLVHRHIVMLERYQGIADALHRSKKPASTVYNRHVPWLAPSQVSTKWRAVALGCGSLWDKFLFTSIPWTKELLARSRDAPLHIALSGYFPMGPLNLQQYQLMLKCLILVCRQSERLESLDLIPAIYHAQSEETQADLRTLVQLMRPELFPALRRISLGKLSPWHAQQGLPPSDFASSFLQAISTNNTSKFIALNIHGIPPSTWGTRTLPTLTDLSLDNCPSVSVFEILHLIKDMPHLACLEVGGCCMEASTETPETILASELHIVLPKLELIHLNLPLLALSAMLKALEFPLSADLSLAASDHYQMTNFLGHHVPAFGLGPEAPYTTDFQTFLPFISSRIHGRFQKIDLGNAKSILASLAHDQFQLALGCQSSMEVKSRNIPTHNSEVQITSDSFFHVLIPLWDDQSSADAPEPRHAFDAMLWEQTEGVLSEVENVICRISSGRQYSVLRSAHDGTTIAKPSTQRLIRNLADLPSVRRLEVSGNGFEIEEYRANVIAFLEILRDEASFLSLETLVLKNFWLEKQDEIEIIQAPPTSINVQNQLNAWYQTMQQAFAQHSLGIPQAAPTVPAPAPAPAPAPTVSNLAQTPATPAPTATQTSPTPTSTQPAPALNPVATWPPQTSQVIQLPDLSQMAPGQTQVVWQSNIGAIPWGMTPAEAQHEQQQRAAHRRPMPSLASILRERIVRGGGPRHLVLEGVGTVNVELIEELKGVEGLDVVLVEGEKKPKKDSLTMVYDGSGWAPDPDGDEIEGYEEEGGQTTLHLGY